MNYDMSLPPAALDNVGRCAPPAPIERGLFCVDGPYMFMTLTSFDYIDVSILFSDASETRIALHLLE